MSRLPRHIAAAVLTTTLAALPNLALAQSSSFDDAFARRGAEARMSFTIPLGSSPDATKTAPRFDLAVRNYDAPTPGAQDWMLKSDNFREARLGVTLGETQTLMLNDQALFTPERDEQANIGTAGKIGLGVVAVGLTLVAIAAVLLLTYDCDDCES